MYVSGHDTSISDIKKGINTAFRPMSAIGGWGPRNPCPRGGRIDRLGSTLQEEHRDHADQPGKTRGAQADAGPFSAGALSSGALSAGTAGLGRGPRVTGRALDDG